MHNLRLYKGMHDSNSQNVFQPTLQKNHMFFPTWPKNQIPSDNSNFGQTKTEKIESHSVS